MLLSIFPATLVLSAVGPEEFALTLLLIIFVVSLVSSAVRPSEYSLALHLIVEPRSLENSSIGPIIPSVSLDIVLLEGSVIGATVGPGELAHAVLLAEDVLTLVSSTIWPCLETLSMLFILEPVSFILGSI